MTQHVNTFIDTVQGAKSTFVKTFVQHEGIAKTLNSFIDAQTKFTKELVKTTTDLTTQVTDELSKFDAKKAFAFAK
jgi:hypothetical protein